MSDGVTSRRPCRALCALAATAGLLLLLGCAGPAAPTTATDQDRASPPDGWTPAGDERTFNSETIFELVNGQASAYFAYNFEQVVVRTYAHADGGTVDAEIWRVAKPGDAYGLFTSNRAGEPIQVGNGGDADAGRRIAFWQDRYYVRVRARQDTPDDVLRRFATAIAAELPEGGELPELVGLLPAGGRVPDSETYFHLESSIQNWVWLGGENILGLDLDTEGVLARYQLGGSDARMVIVSFADEKTAQAALGILRSAAIDGLVAAGAEGGLLAAVFGGASDADAQSLLSEALARD